MSARRVTATYVTGTGTGIVLSQTTGRTHALIQAINRSYGRVRVRELYLTMPDGSSLKQINCPCKFTQDWEQRTERRLKCRVKKTYIIQFVRIAPDSSSDQPLLLRAYLQEIKMPELLYLSKDQGSAGCTFYEYSSGNTLAIKSSVAPQNRSHWSLYCKHTGDS